MVRHTVVSELFYDGVWNYHTTDMRQTSALDISSGVSDISQEITPGAAKFSWDNPTGKMNPPNPKGALIGKIGQNTPIRISIDGSQRFYGEVAKWTPTRGVKGNAQVIATCAGILRRLGRGVDPLRSPIHRAVTFDNPIAFFPLSDGQNATQAGSALSSGGALAPTGTVKFAAVDGPAGDQQKFPELAGGADNSVIVGALQGSIPGADVGAWSVEWWFKAEGLPGGTPLCECVRIRFAGTSKFDTMTCQIQGDPVNPYVSVYFIDTTGSIVDGPYARFIQPYGTGWHHVRVTAVQNSPTSATIAGYIDGVLGATATFNTDIGYPVSALVGSVEAPGAFDMNFDVVSLSVADLAVYGAVVGNHNSAGLGWAGELAGDRFNRLNAEQGIASSVVGTVGETQPMGIQGVTTLLEQYAEIERTEQGRIYESRGALELVLRTGASMLNQASVLTLDYEGGQISPDPPLEPVVGDEHIRNDVTAASPSGSTGRYEQTSGPHNVQEPGTAEGAVGRYTTRIDVNPYDQSLLPSFAGRRVLLGTFNGTWYESVTVDLDAAPELTAAVAAVTIGDKITLVNLPEDETNGAVEHLVIGIAESMPTQRRRLVTFNLIPARPYTMGILGPTNVEGWLDCGASTTSAALTSTQTTIPVECSDECVWGHSDGDFPITIGPEDMTLKAVAAAAGDTFTRTVANDWGTADVGGTYTCDGAGGSILSSDFQVTGSVGTLSVPTTAAMRQAKLTSLSFVHVDATVSWSSPVTATGGVLEPASITVRGTGTTSYYHFRVHLNTDNTVQVVIYAPSGVVIASRTLGELTYSAGLLCKLRAYAVGSLFAAKVWKATDTEPTEWACWGFNSERLTGGFIGLRAGIGSGNTNAKPVVFTFDNLVLARPQVLTVERSLNGVVTAHAAGREVHVRDPFILAL